MGYFSNGTEGEIYEAKFCANCAHRDGPDGKSGCAVWLAHMLHNYGECNKPDSILHLLIPRSKEGVGNERCTMFIEDRLVRPGVRLMPMYSVGDKGQRYEISATGYPLDGKTTVMGWSDDRAMASNMAAALRKAPGCTSTTIRDRWGREADSTLEVKGTA